MPGLSLQDSHAFWQNYPDPMIYRVLSFMESVENWTYDGDPKLEHTIEQLAQALDGVIQFELKDQEAYVNLGNYIHMSRILHLMQTIDTTHPGSASRLLMHAEDTTQSDDDPAGLFLRRNVVFERLRLLGRVFSNERLNLVQRAFEGEEDDE